MVPFFFIFFSLCFALEQWIINLTVKAFHWSFKVRLCNFWKKNWHVSKGKFQFISNETHHCSVQYTLGFCCSTRTWSGMTCSLRWLMLVEADIAVKLTLLSQLFDFMSLLLVTLLHYILTFTIIVTCDHNGCCSQMLYRHILSDFIFNVFCMSGRKRQWWCTLLMWCCLKASWCSILRRSETFSKWSCL